MRWGVVVAVLVAVPAGGRAEPVDDVQAARDHFAKGKRLYDLGRFADAASEYELAYRAKDDPALLFNIGQAYRLAGVPAKALLAYKAYLRNVPDAPNRGEVEKWIGELQARTDRSATVAIPAAPAPTATAATTNQLVASPPPPRRSIVKRPWFWAAVIGGAAVVATGVALGVVYGRQDPTASAGKVIGP